MPNGNRLEAFSPKRTIKQNFPNRIKRHTRPRRTIPLPNTPKAFGTGRFQTGKNVRSLLGLREAYTMKKAPLFSGGVVQNAKCFGNGRLRSLRMRGKEHTPSHRLVFQRQDLNLLSTIAYRNRTIVICLCLSHLSYRSIYPTYRWNVTA